MFLASSLENTSKKSWYASGTTLAKSLASSVGRGSEWRAVVGAGLLPTARKASMFWWSVVGWILIVYTCSPASISRLKAATPIRLIEGGVVLLKNSCSGSPRKGRVSSSSQSDVVSSLVSCGSWYWLNGRLGICYRIQVVNMLDGCIADWFGAGWQNGSILIVDLFNVG